GRVEAAEPPPESRAFAEVVRDLLQVLRKQSGEFAERPGVAGESSTLQKLPQLGGRVGEQTAAGEPAEVLGKFRARGLQRLALVGSTARRRRLIALQRLLRPLHRVVLGRELAGNLVAQCVGGLPGGRVGPILGSAPDALDLLFELLLLLWR